MWVATQDLPLSAGHAFYTRLNHILDKADFDGYVESLCQRFYADEIIRDLRNCSKNRFSRPSRSARTPRTTHVIHTRRPTRATSAR